MQGAGLPFRSNWGFSVLLQDTLTCGQGEPGIKQSSNSWTICSTAPATALSHAKQAHNDEHPFGGRHHRVTKRSQFQMFQQPVHHLTTPGNSE